MVKPMDSFPMLDQVWYNPLDDSYIVSIQDQESLTSAISTSNTLSELTRGEVPEMHPGSLELREARSEDVHDYIHEVVRRTMEALPRRGGPALGPDVLLPIARTHLSELVDCEVDDLPRAVIAMRTSSTWADADENHGQSGRLYETLEAAVGNGYLPGLIVADAESGQQSRRPGLLHALHEGMGGDYAAFYAHTIDRFSRSAISGVCMFRLAFRIFGVVFYKDLRQEKFHPFHGDCRTDVNAVVEQIQYGDREAMEIESRLLRGVRNQLKREQATQFPLVRRLFQRGV